MTIPGYAAVLLDVVDSRGHGSRAELQTALLACLAAANRGIASSDLIDPLAITIGDEAQATTSTLAGALALAGTARLHLLVEGIELRVGIGWGTIVVRDPDRSPLAQDGPAWWAAREALDQVTAATAWSDYPRRTGIVVARDTDASPGEGLPSPRPADLTPGPFLDSYLALLDRNLATLDAEDAAVVLNDIAGDDTATVANRLEVAANAVSMRRSRNHLRELSHALRVLVATQPLVAS